MHVLQLFLQFLLAPHIEIIESSLPTMRPFIATSLEWKRQLAGGRPLTRRDDFDFVFSCRGAASLVIFKGAGFDSSSLRPVSPSNRSILQTTIQPLNPTTKNQLEDTNGDYVYDAAGNLTQPGPIGGPYVYDAENHLTSADGVTYTYDGDGNRVMKSNGTIYWYGANSASLDESDLSGNLQRWYYFFNGQRVGRGLTTNEVGFYMTDALGSVRYLGGSATGYRFDYFPFGAPILDSDTGDDRYQFTGKERDAESGLDNFGARYMASTMGRFMSADPFTVTPGRVVDPQQLNLYAYVRNNPLRHIDPTGMLIDDAACKQDMKHCGKDWQKVQDIANQQDKNGNYLHPELHNELTALQNDSRTFTIENSSLGAGTAGQFTITNFTADGKDFTKATLQLDFKQIKGISGVTGADLVPGFNKYQGLLDSPMYRLAETFGHEAGHGLFSIQNPGQAVGIQQLLNQRDAAMQGQHYPYPPDVMQKMQQADQALIPTERFAQQVEKIVNGELSAGKKKQ